MRVKIWKDGLYCGTWVTTKGQVFHCGPDDLVHFRDRTRDMLACGAAIPWVWEHRKGDPNDAQLSAADLLAQWAKNTGGHIRDAKIENGVLQLLMDVDEADRGKLEAIKFVSPDLRHNWTDRNGPALDEHGLPYWPGQSIAHLAVTPIPVQYPQRPFRFDGELGGQRPAAGALPPGVLSLSAAAVDVSLSAATYKPGDDDMPATPDAKADEKDQPEGLPEEPGEDLEGGGPVTDPAETGTPAAECDVAGDTALIHKLSQSIAELGMVVEPTAGMTLRSYVEHLCTAVATHKATKANGVPDQPQPDQPQPTQDQPDPYQEPEVAESPPIQMSAAPQPAPPSAHEQKLAKALLAQSTATLRARIGALHARGYIDDSIKRELEGELASVKLSAGDVTDDGELRPTAVAIKVGAYERLAKAGKPGSFGRPSPRPAPGNPAAPNPARPVSSAVSLSAAGAGEEVVEPPYGEPSEGGELDPHVMSRITGGAWRKRSAA